MENVYMIYMNKAGNDKEGQGLARPYQEEAFEELMNSSDVQRSFNKDGYNFELTRCIDDNVVKLTRENGKLGGFLSNDLKKLESTWHMYSRIVIETGKDVLASLRN